MKIRISLAAIFSLLLFSCSENQQRTTNDSAAGDSIPSVAPSPVPKNDTTAVAKKDTMQTPPVSASTIAGTMFYNRNYCGGMRPSDEMLEDLRKWRRLANTRLKLVSKSGKPEVFVESDAKGVFSAGIVEGKYDVYLLRVDPTIYDISPDACENCQTQPMATINVEKNKKTEIYITFRCGPMDKRRQ